MDKSRWTIRPENVEHKNGVGVIDEEAPMNDDRMLEPIR